MAFEALSRGARFALLVDRERVVCSALRKSARELDVLDETQVLQADLFRGRSRALDRIAAAGPFELVFADPPYADAGSVVDLLEALWRRGVLAEGAFVVVERPASRTLESIEGLALVAQYRYGDTTADLFTPAPPPARISSPKGGGMR